MISQQQLFVGSSLYPPYHMTYLESLIPNSQVIVNPPHPDSIEAAMPTSGNTTYSPVKQRSREWRSELFLRPSDWVVDVGGAVAGAVVILGILVYGLNQRERVSLHDRAALTAA